MGQDHFYPMKKVGNKKRKMEVDKEEQKIIDVNVLVNKWLQAQKDICEVLLSMVNKINELEKK